MAGMVDMKASEAMASLTCKIRVTGMKRMHVRWWIGMQMLSLAVWIMGTKADIKVV